MLKLCLGGGTDFSIRYFLDNNKPVKGEAMYRTLLLSSLFSLFMPVLAGADEAQNANKSFFDNFSGDIGLYSHYVGRGRVQADDDPALQASINYNQEIAKNTNIFMGVWGSNTDFNDGDEATVELDIYGGVSHTLQDLTLKTGFIQYWYPGADRGLNYDYYEIMAGASYNFDVLSTSATVKYSPDFFGASGDATYYHFDVNVPLPHGFAFGAHIGRQEVDQWAKFGFRDYDHWGARIAYTAKDLKNIRFSLDYKNTNISRAGCPERWCDGLFVAGVSKSF